MTRNMIFVSAILAVLAVIAVASLLGGQRPADVTWDIASNRSGDELVIEGNSEGTVIRTPTGDVRCDKAEDSVTVTRGNGQEITITCD